MTLDDKQLEALLRTRSYEPPSTNLAERIILAARRHSSQPEFLPWFLSLFTPLLPRSPAYALAGVLALGVLIGFAVPQSATEMTAQSYLDDEGVTL